MNTLWSCENQGDLALKFIDVKTIQSVVAMIPHRPALSALAPQTEHPERFFLVEKPGLDVAMLTGMEEDFPVDEGGTEIVDAS